MDQLFVEELLMRHKPMTSIVQKRKVADTRMIIQENEILRRTPKAKPRVAFNNSKVTHSIEYHSSMDNSMESCRYDKQAQRRMPQYILEKDKGQTNTNVMMIKKFVPTRISKDKYYEKANV